MLVLPQTRRAEDSRARILSAARARFAAVGFERTTIRSVAAEARIDPSMVMRYFGSKEGLFAAAADIDLALPALAGLSPQAAAQHLAQAVVRLWATPGPLELLLRSAVSNPAAAVRLRDVLATSLAPALAPLLPEADRDQRLALIASQMLGYGVARRIVALPDLEDDARTEALLATAIAALLA